VRARGRSARLANRGLFAIWSWLDRDMRSRQA
jgi:hypothetical protein